MSVKTLMLETEHLAPGMKIISLITPIGGESFKRIETITKTSSRFITTGRAGLSATYSRKTGKRKGANQIALFETDQEDAIALFEREQRRIADEKNEIALAESKRRLEERAKDPRTPYIELFENGTSGFFRLKLSQLQQISEWLKAAEMQRPPCGVYDQVLEAATVAANKGTGGNWQDWMRLFRDNPQARPELISLCNALERFL